MSENVLQQMEAESGRLVAHLVKNHEVCSALMGFLTILCNTAINQMGKPVAGIHMGDIAVNGNTFTAKIQFNSFSMAPRVSWSPKKEFAEFMADKAGALALALAVNPSLNNFCTDLVERLILHAKFKGYPFEKMNVVKHVITKDWVVVMEVARGFDA